MNSILNANSIEFFADHGAVFFIKDSYVHPFDDLPCADAEALRRDMERSEAVVNAIESVISDPIEQLRQYAACRYGKLNNIPDFVNGQPTDHEACSNTCRDTCKFNFKLCVKPTAPYGEPTRSEIKVASLLPGNTDKQIAQKLNCSVNTVISHEAHLRDKTGTTNRTGLMRWALEMNLF